jgi:hypothetical protein
VIILEKIFVVSKPESKKLFLKNLLADVSFKIYRGADKSLARPGRKKVTATEDFDFRISYL